MCNFLSALVLKNGDVLSHPMLDSHNDLVTYFKLPDTNAYIRYFVKVELTPVDWLDPATWKWVVDEEVPPIWWDNVKEQAEATLRSRAGHMILKDGKHCLIVDGCWIVGGTANIKDMRAGRIWHIQDSARVSGVGGSAHISDVGDFARISGVRDSARVSYVRDSARVSDVGDSAHISDVGDFARVSGVWGFARVSGVWGFARVSGVGGSAHISDVGDFARISGVRDSARVSYVRDSACVPGVWGFARVSGVGGSAHISDVGNKVVLDASAIARMTQG